MKKNLRRRCLAMLLMLAMMVGLMCRSAHPLAVKAADFFH